MITILAHIGTDQVKSRFEECAKANGYHVDEWLTPGYNGKGLRVSATMKIGKQKHGLGFKWDGEDINDLASRCMALDLSMAALPGNVYRSGGKYAVWNEDTMQ